AAGIDQSPAAIGEPAELIDAVVVNPVFQTELAVALAFQGFGNGADQAAAVIGVYSGVEFGCLGAMLIGGQTCQRVELGIPDQLPAADVVFPCAAPSDLACQADCLLGVVQALSRAGRFHDAVIP